MLILIAHGSPSRHWRASVEKLTESLQVDLGRDRVHLCYMEGDPPTLMDVASDAVRRGIKRLRVLPLFLTSEGHVDRNIRPLVDEVCRAHGDVDIELLPPVGQHPLFQKLLREIAVQSADT
ncbi:MAG: sirohydrochlorin chelatase [Planctomycetota bacterium]|jgi:sirohydrochlorin cobaltochelatase